MEKVSEISERKYKANPNFLLREIGGECVLVPVGDAGVFDNSLISLNDSFGFLWKFFQDAHTVSQAVDAVLEQYSCSKSEAEQDIVNFVNQTLEYNLIQGEI